MVNNGVDKKKYSITEAFFLFVLDATEKNHFFARLTRLIDSTVSINGLELCPCGKRTKSAGFRKKKGG